MKLKKIKSPKEEFYIDAEGRKQGVKLKFQYIVDINSLSVEKAISLSSTYLDDKKHGLEIEYYNSSTSIFEERMYKNGLLHGQSKWFHLNGKICLFEIYEEGIRHGEYKMRDKRGKVIHHCIYRNGNKEDLSAQERKELNHIRSKEKHLNMRIKYGVPLLSDSKYGQ